MPIADRESTHPKRAVPLCHGMNSACTVSPWVVNPRTGRDFGRRPRQPTGNLLATRTLVPAPKTPADARRPCRKSRTQFGNPRNPDRESGPRQAPPIHWVTDSQQGEFNGIPGLILRNQHWSHGLPGFRVQVPLRSGCIGHRSTWFRV